MRHTTYAPADPGSRCGAAEDNYRLAAVDGAIVLDSPESLGLGNYLSRRIVAGFSTRLRPRAMASGSSKAASFRQ